MRKLWALVLLAITSGVAFAQLPLIGTNVNKVVYSSAYPSLNAAVAGCPLGGGCTVIISAPTSLTASLTTAGTTTLEFDQPGALTTTGFTLTANGPIVAGPYRIFTGSGTVTFGVQGSTKPAVEWFGAVGDWNGTTGTDNTVAIQACLNALTVGQCQLQALSYAISAPLTINRSSIGVKGVGMRVTNNALYTNPIASVLMNTSATADSIDVAGTGGSNFIGFNKFEDFDIERSVVPSGTAAGLSLSFTYGVVVARVGIQDSIRDLYVHATGSQGNGFIEDSVFQWGFNGVTETSGNLYGIYIDSSDGNQNPSFRVRHSFAVSNGLSATTFGVELTGTSINDQMFDGFETSNVSYGVDIDLTSVAGAGAASDIHFDNGINDGCSVSCYRITGVLETGSGYVEIAGGYNNTSAFTPAIDIENSSGVRVLGAQIGLFNGASAESACVLVGNNSASISLVGNLCQGVHNAGFILSHSSSTSVIGNNFIGAGDTDGLIALTSAVFNTISGNTMSGSGQSLIVDVNSTGNTGLDSNAITGLAAPSILGDNPLTQSFSVAGCTTGSTTDSNCSGTITLPAAMANTNYIPTLTVNATASSGAGPFLYAVISGPLTTTTIPYTITCTFGCAVSTAATIYVSAKQN